MILKVSLKLLKELFCNYYNREKENSPLKNTNLSL